MHQLNENSGQMVLGLTSLEPCQVLESWKGQQTAPMHTCTDHILQMTKNNDNRLTAIITLLAGTQGTRGKNSRICSSKVLLLVLMTTSSLGLEDAIHHYVWHS